MSNETNQTIIQNNMDEVKARAKSVLDESRLAAAIAPQEASGASDKAKDAARAATKQQVIKYEVLPLSNLFIDHRYQRPLNRDRVKKVVTQFDPNMFAPIEVSARPDGTYAVFEGQHRREVAKELGFPTMMCRVHYGLAPKEEADLFVRLQQERKNISAVARHRALVFQGDPTASAIDKIVADCGFQIREGQGKNVIQAATNVSMVYRAHGAQGLEDTLMLIRSLWFGSKRATHGNFITGVARFLANYGHKLKPSQRDKLAMRTPAWYIRESGMEGMSGKGRADRLMCEILRKESGIRLSSNRNAETDEAS